MRSACSSRGISAVWKTNMASYSCTTCSSSSPLNQIAAQAREPVVERLAQERQAEAAAQPAAAAVTAAAPEGQGLSIDRYA
jgi:hypothetical protein